MNTKLFTPLTLKNITLKNRIVMSPMCMYSADENGMAQNWHYTHYISRAVGQVGLIMLEATAITPEGRISLHDLGIWDDEHIDGLKSLVTDIKRNDSKVGIQLAHAGRKSTVPGEILAPSAIAFNEESRQPKEMTIHLIKKIIDDFQQAAIRSMKAGFDVIEIHAAHGYLLNEFLSPLSNKRQDEYGGSKENRYRILGEIIDSIREVWNGPLFVRISANDYVKEGLSVTDYVEICSWMKEQDVDVIDVSSGAVVPAQIPTYPGYQVPYAEQIKREVQIPTGAVGMITSGIQAEEILQNSRADLIFIGRALLNDPYWPRSAAQELHASLQAPVQYERGWSINR